MKFEKRKNKKEKDNFWVPKNVQESIPVKRIYKDGTFFLGNDRYSKTYRFTDVNYAVSPNEEKENIFMKYCELLNSFDSGAMHKFNIINRKLNKKDFEKAMLMKSIEDGLDRFRKEVNGILLDSLKTSNGIIQEKFITKAKSPIKLNGLLMILNATNNVAITTQNKISIIVPTKRFLVETISIFLFYHSLIYFQSIVKLY